MPRLEALGVSERRKADRLQRLELQRMLGPGMKNDQAIGQFAVIPHRFGRELVNKRCNLANVPRGRYPAIVGDATAAKHSDRTPSPSSSSSSVIVSGVKNRITLPKVPAAIRMTPRAHARR